jgi:hypothetical protein
MITWLGEISTLKPTHFICSESACRWASRKLLYIRGYEVCHDMGAISRGSHKPLKGLTDTPSMIPSIH